MIGALVGLAVMSAGGLIVVLPLVVRADAKAHKARADEDDRAPVLQPIEGTLIR